MQSFAIEGLRISVPCPDVILGWPSSSDETYIVQWRSTLSTNTPWVTLTDWLPASSSTNWTTFVDSDRVQCASSGGDSMMMMMSSGEASSEPSLLDSMIALALRTSQPLVVQNDGSGVVLPLGVYPPGSDLSAFTIFEPSSGESVSGAGYIVSQPSLNRAQLNDSETEEDDPGDPPPDPGFYRVVRDGAHLVGITNGMTLSGVVVIPVEVGNADGNLVNLSLTEGGSPVSGGLVQTPPFPFPLQLVVDTTQMSNGVHQISASATWNVPGNEDEPFCQADSPAVAVNIGNDISFPDWMPTFGQDYDSLLITAQSKHTNADWYIDVYGEQEDYIGTFSGHTDDGSIGVVWNLLGPYAEYHADSVFQFVVTTAYAGGGNVPSSTALAPPAFKNYDRWGTQGGWVVANQLAWAGWVGGENLNTMTDGFVQDAEYVPLTVRPNHSSGEAFRIHYKDTQEAYDWEAFRQALYNPASRNLFYCGHGGDNGIGRDASDINRFIPQEEIGIALNTIPPGQTNRHGFRFVFLDGCESAKGQFPDAFGMVHKENLDFQYYYYAGERYSAFVGWNIEPAIGTLAGHTVNVYHWKFIQNFLYNWTSGAWPSVREALNHAGNGPLGWTDVNPQTLTVFGYRDLGYNQSN